MRNLDLEEKNGKVDHNEDLFARHPSPVTNGPAACGAALWLGALAGNRSEQALETLGLGSRGRVRRQHPVQRVFTYGLNVYQGISENLR